MLSFEEGMEQLSILNELYDFNCSATAVAETQLRAAFMYQTTGDKEYVAEGFSDIVSTICDAIKRLIDSIVKFFKNVFRTLMAMGMDYREFVKNYKKDLQEASPNFTYKGYTYAGIWKKEPDMSEFEMAIEKYNRLIQSPDKKEMKEGTLDIQKYLDVVNLDRVRAKILGENGSIEEETYTEEVREFYRGSKSEEDITVDSSYVNKLISEVDEVYKLKDKAEKDRNHIVALLSQTENFFAKKAAVVYRGNVREISTKTVNYDKENQKVKFDDATIDYSEDMSIIVTKLINTMYTQVRALSGIINICVSERAIAFRDYIKQCRKILGLAVKGKKDDKVEERAAEEGYVVLDGTVLEEAANYSDIWEQGMLSLQSKLIMEEINYQYAIANHAVACFESGYITEPVMEGIIGDAIQAIKNFFANLAALFRKKQVENVKKYEPWYTNQDVIDAVSANAMSKEFTVLPLWDGLYGRKVDLVFGNIIKDVMHYEKNTYPWAKHILGYDSVSQFKSDKEIKKKCINFFRAGKAETYIEPEKIGGAKLKGKVAEMFRYMGEYETECKVIDMIKRELDSLKEPAGIVNESLMDGALGYLDMAGVVLMEVGVPPTTPASEANKINKEGNKEAQQSATEIREENKESSGVGKEGTKKPAPAEGNDKVEYFKKGLTFTQSACQSLFTSMEERYTLYWKLLTSIAPDDMKPIFKDGVYQGTKKTGLLQKLKDKKDIHAEKKGKKDQDATRIVANKVK